MAFPTLLLERPRGMVSVFPQKEQLEGPRWRLYCLLSSHHVCSILRVTWVSPDSAQEGRTQDVNTRRRWSWGHLKGWLPHRALRRCLQRAQYTCSASIMRHGDDKEQIEPCFTNGSQETGPGDVKWCHSSHSPLVVEPAEAAGFLTCLFRVSLSTEKIPVETQRRGTTC